MAGPSRVRSAIVGQHGRRAKRGEVRWYRWGPGQADRTCIAVDSLAMQVEENVRHTSELAVP